jgi:hypothetical protein
MARNKNNLILAARICLIVTALSTLRFYLSYFQNKYQLDGPLIPKDIANKLSNPYLTVALISTIIIIIATISVFKSNYVLAIGACGLMPVFHQLFLFLITNDLL